MSTAPALTLLVHDYDAVAVEKRGRQLREALPHADVRCFNRRDELLDEIAKRKPAPPQGPWPLALIDLHDEGVRAPGEHLLATINEHPDLRGRVALIAFTRYGFDNRMESLREKGARAILSPVNLRNQDGLRSALGLLAGGSNVFARIGEPPSRHKDSEVVGQLARLFPELDAPDLDESKRWERAREILLICRLDREGHDDKAIKSVTGISRRRFEKLRDQLAASPATRAAGLIAPAAKKAELGRVIDFLGPHLDETQLIWDVVEEREHLTGPGRIEWVRDRVDNRYAPLPAPVKSRGDTWIPPDYLYALRRFLVIYDDLPKKKPSETIESALRQLAKETGLNLDTARHYVTHAVMCLEDAEDERENRNAS